MDFRVLHSITGCGGRAFRPSSTPRLAKTARFEGCSSWTGPASCCSMISTRRSANATRRAREATTFLTELDGLHPREGIVYLFTSNLSPARIDRAARRPGRIDLLLHFPRPDTA